MLNTWISGKLKVSQIHDLPLIEKSKNFFIVELMIHIQTFSEQAFFLKTKFS